MAIQFVAKGVDGATGPEGPPGSGSGGTPFNWQDVVEDHGADPTGATDSTTEIQAAIAAAGNGGTVVFPKGAYMVSGASGAHCLDISTYSNITLMGLSMGLQNPSAEGGSSTIFTTSANTTIIKSEAAAINHRGPKVLDLRIETRVASGIGFSLRDYNHYVFERVTFRGIGGATATSTGLKINGVEDASYGRIEGCHFHNHLYDCVTVNSVGATFGGSCYFNATTPNHVLLDLQGASAVVVMGAKFQGNTTFGGTNGIAIRQGVVGGVISGDVEIVGCNFEACPTGINLSAPGSATNTHTQIHANSFTGYNATETAIIVGANRQHDQIIGNRFSNNGTIITDNGTNTLIIGGRVGSTQTGEFIRMGGVYVGSGTAAPPNPATPPPNGSLYLQSGVGVHRRITGGWRQLGTTADLGSGTASSSTFLRGDQTWATPPGSAPALERTLLSNTAVGAGSFVVNTAPLAALANGAYVVIDPFTIQCEVRKITTITTTTVAFGDNLRYAHAAGDLILFVTSTEAHAAWWGVEADGTNKGDELNAALVELATTRDMNWLKLPSGPIGTTIPIDVQFNQHFTGAGPGTGPDGTTIDVLPGFTFSNADVAVVRTYRSNGTLVTHSGSPGMTQTYLADFRINGNGITGANGILSSQQQPARWGDLRIDNCPGSYGLCLHDGQDIKIDSLEIINCALPIDHKGQDMLTIDRLNIEQTTGTRDVWIHRGGAGEDPLACHYGNVHIEMDDTANGHIAFDIDAGKGISIDPRQVSCQGAFTTTIIDVDHQAGGANRVRWETTSLHASGDLTKVTMTNDHDKPEVILATDANVFDGWLPYASSQ